MADKTIELNRRRVLGGMITIGGAAAAAGAGTFAYFSDTETSNNNTIQAGILSLASASDGQLDITNLVPGESVPNGGGTTSIQTTYESASSVDAEVDFSCALGEPSEPSEPSGSTDQTAADFADQLSVNTAELHRNGSKETDLTTSPQSVSTALDLNSLSVDDGFGTVTPGDTVSLVLGLDFPTSVGNAYQADGVTINATFTAEQPSED